MKKKKVLVIVAHPDDETIWMGGYLLRNKKNWNTTVICLARAKDKDRAPKFKNVCKKLGVKSFIYNFEDEKKLPIPLEEYKKTLTKFSKTKYDIIFTHGSNGEYGHIRHKETHKAIKKLIKQKILKSKKVLFFSYKRRDNNYQGYAIYNSSADIFIKLNHNELLMKKKLVQDVYGFSKGGLEELSAAKTEAFNIHKK